MNNIPKSSEDKPTNQSPGRDPQGSPAQVPAVSNNIMLSDNQSTQRGIGQGSLATGPSRVHSQVPQGQDSLVLETAPVQNQLPSSSGTPSAYYQLLKSGIDRVTIDAVLAHFQPNGFPMNQSTTRAPSQSATTLPPPATNGQVDDLGAVAAPLNQPASSQSAAQGPLAPPATPAMTLEANTAPHPETKKPKPSRVGHYVYEYSTAPREFKAQVFEDKRTRSGKIQPQPTTSCQMAGIPPRAPRQTVKNAAKPKAPKPDTQPLSESVGQDENCDIVGSDPVAASSSGVSGKKLKLQEQASEESQNSGSGATQTTDSNLVQQSRGPAPLATSLNPSTSAAPPPITFQQLRSAVKRPADTTISKKPVKTVAYSASSRPCNFGPQGVPKSNQISTVMNIVPGLVYVQKAGPSVNNVPIRPSSGRLSVNTERSLPAQTIQGISQGSLMAAQIPRGQQPVLGVQKNRLMSENQGRVPSTSVAPSATGAAQSAQAPAVPAVLPARPEMVPEHVSEQLPVAGNFSAHQATSQTSEPVIAPPPVSQQLQTIKVEEDSDFEILDAEQPAAQEAPAPAPPPPTPATSEVEDRRLQELLAELSTYRPSQQLTDGLTAVFGKELVVSPRTIRFQWPYDTERNTVLNLENRCDYPVSYQVFSNMPDRIKPFNAMKGEIQPGCSVKVDIKHFSFIYEKQENVGADKITVRWTKMTDGKMDTRLFRQKEVAVVYEDKDE